MSEPVLQFTDDMRRENIKSLSWYLLKKYLEGGSRCPVLLNVMTDYVSECRVAGDCFLFVKMLSLLILSEQAEPTEEGTELAIIRNIYDTLIEIREHCGKQLEQTRKNLDQLIAEARCQVIVSHLMYDDVDSALVHWRDFYADKDFTEDPLGSQLHQILNYLSEDSYRKKLDEAKNLSINLFFTKHELSGLCKDVRSFVELCCSNVIKAPKTIRYNLRSATNLSSSSAAKPGPSSIINNNNITVQKRSGVSKPATRSGQAATTSLTTPPPPPSSGGKTVRVSVRSTDSPAPQLEVFVERAQKRPTRRAARETAQRTLSKGVIRKTPVKRVGGGSPVGGVEVDPQMDMGDGGGVESQEEEEEVGQINSPVSSHGEGGVANATPTSTDAELSPHTSPQKRKPSAEKAPPQTPPPRKRLPRNAKLKPTKSAVDSSEYDFTSSEDDDLVVMQPDITLEATPTSKLPARLTPVHFKRAFLNAGNGKQNTSKSSPRRPFPAFRRPQKKKVKFSMQETEYLMAGIKRYGFGNWAVILSKYPFHPSRDKVSLKDKARNLRGRY